MTKAQIIVCTNAQRAYSGKHLSLNQRIQTSARRSWNSIIMEIVWGRRRDSTRSSRRSDMQTQTIWVTRANEMA